MFVLLLYLKNHPSLHSKMLLLLLLILFPLGLLCADPGITEQAEDMFEAGNFEAAISLIEHNLDDETDFARKSDLYTRLAKYTFQQAKISERSGTPKQTLLALYSKGEAYADKAVQLDPTNHLAYFWRGSNSGMWGKLKGLFSALDRVKDMHDDFRRTVELEPGHSLAWFSLGQMYRRVPGGIISFGNKDYAVSLGRKAVDVMREQVRLGQIDGVRYDYYIELALSLHTRNWNLRKRETEYDKKWMEYLSTHDVLEKNFLYEGMLAIKSLSDREEAKEIITWTINELEAVDGRSVWQQEYLAEAKKVFKDKF